MAKRGSVQELERIRRRRLLEQTRQAAPVTPTVIPLEEQAGPPIPPGLQAERLLEGIAQEAQADKQARQAEYEKGKPKIPLYMQAPMMGMNPAAFQPPSRTVEALAGLDVPTTKAGYKAMTEGETLEEKAAGARKVGEGAGGALLRAISVPIAAGGAGALAKEGVKGLGRYARKQAAEVGAGLGAEKLAYEGIKAAGETGEKYDIPWLKELKPNTAAVISALVTLPFGVRSLQRANEAMRGPAPEIHSIIADEVVEDAGEKAARIAAEAAARATPLRGAKNAAASSSKPAGTSTPSPGPNVTIRTAGEEAGVRVAAVPVSEAQAKRVAAIDKELDEVATEFTQISQKGTPDEATLAAYQERINDLVAQREAASVPPKPTLALPEPSTKAGVAPAPERPIAATPDKVGAVPMSQAQARARARLLASKLAMEAETLPATEQARLTAELDQLRKYGGEGALDQPPVRLEDTYEPEIPAKDDLLGEGVPASEAKPRTPSPEELERMAALEKSIVDLNAKPKAERTPEVEAQIGRELLELRRLRTSLEEPARPTPVEQTEAQLFPEPYGPEVKGQIAGEGSLFDEPDIRARQQAAQAEATANAAAREAEAAKLRKLQAMAEGRVRSAKEKNADATKLEALVAKLKTDVDKIAGVKDDALTALVADLEQQAADLRAPQPTSQVRMEAPESIGTPAGADQPTLLAPEDVAIDVPPEMAQYSSLMEPNLGAEPGMASGVRPEPPFPKSRTEAQLQLEQLQKVTPATPEEAGVVAQRMQDLQRFLDDVPEDYVPPSPRPGVEGYVAEQQFDPGTQAAWTPSESTIELNYPRWRAESEQFRKLKAESEAAAEQARQLRDSLMYRGALSESQERSMRAQLAAYEKKIGAHERYRQAEEARRAIDEWAKNNPNRRSFLDYLVKAESKTKKKPPKGAKVSGEQGTVRPGNTPAKKWRDPADIQDRPRNFRQDQTPMIGRQLEARITSRVEQLADVEQRIAEAQQNGRDPGSLVQQRDQLAEEVTKLQADQARVEIDTERTVGPREVIDRYPAEDADVPGRPGLLGKLLSAPKKMFYDSDWRFRHLADDLQDTAQYKKAAGALNKIADRFREVQVIATVRASRELSTIWKIGGKHSKKGLAFLSEDERLNLFDVLTENATPANDHVQLVADRVRATFDNLADTFEAIGGKTYDKELGSWRAFSRRTGYAPKLAPPLRALAEDSNVRRRVAGYMQKRFGIDGPTAQRMMDEFVSLHSAKKASKESLLAKWLVETRQARDLLEATKMLETYVQPRIGRSSSLEFSRTMDLPFVDPDLQSSLPEWLRSNWERLSWIERFGQELPEGAKLVGETQKPTKLADVAGDQLYYEQLETLDELLTTVQQVSPELGVQAAERINDALGRYTVDQQLAMISRVVRELGVFRLSWLATDNFFQGALGSMLRGDMASTMRALSAAFTEEGYKLATQSGSEKIDTTLHPVFFGGEDFSPGTLSRITSGFLKITVVAGTENANRRISATAAHNYVDDLYRRMQGAASDSSDARFAAKELKKFGLPVNREPTDEEMLGAAFIFDREVNFETTPWLRPDWTNNAWGKLITQYMNWGYQQARLVYQESYGRLAAGIQEKNPAEFKKGLRNVILLTTVYPAAGMFARLSRAGLKGAGAMAMAGAVGRDPYEYDSYEEEVEFMRDDPLRFELGGGAYVSPRMYALGGLRMGTVPSVPGEIAQSLIQTGGFPSMPTIVGGLVPDVMEEVVGKPMAAWLTTAIDELQYKDPDLFGAPMKAGTAEFVKGVSSKVTPFDAWTKPVADEISEQLGQE